MARPGPRPTRRNCSWREPMPTLRRRTARGNDVCSLFLYHRSLFSPVPLERTMKKMHLDLDRLRVETFDTSDVEKAPRGTVYGHYSQRGTCDAFVGTCQYGGSCGAGCGTVGG